MEWRHGNERDIAARMEYQGISLRKAAEAVVHGTLSAGDGGISAVDGDGNVVLLFNTEGMFRGVADSSGRFEVAIWSK